MKLNRRGFLRATGLAALLTAFGIELPEAAGKLPAVTPATGGVKIQVDGLLQFRRDWLHRLQREQLQISGSFVPLMSVGEPLQIHTFQHTLAVSDELALDADFLALPEFRDWLTAHYAVCYAKVTEAEILTDSP